MQALLGIIYHVIGGIAAGSFYMPYKKVKGWKWETYWMVGGLFSWIIVPFIAAWFSYPEFMHVIFTHTEVLPYTFLFGFLWGIGGLTYGLGIRYLGMSLGNSFILGITLSFGSLLPAIFYDFYPKEGKDTFSGLLSSTGGQIILLGIFICLIGIALSGRAGMLKEKGKKEVSSNSGKEFNLKTGLILGLISGILSACFNYGIDAGKPLAEEMVKAGVNPLMQNNIIFVVILWGGFTTNFLSCIYIALKEKSYSDYTEPSKPLFKNYIFSAIAGTMWFLQFFFYGMGESKMGNGASSWILHMCSYILVANIWGYILKEWEGVQPKARNTMIGSIATLLVAIAIVGYGTSLK